MGIIIDPAILSLNESVLIGQSRSSSSGKCLELMSIP